LQAEIHWSGEHLEVLRKKFNFIVKQYETHWNIMNMGSTKRGNPFLLGRNAVTWCQWMSMGEDLFDYQRVDAGSTLWSTIIAGWPSQEIYTVHMYI
jgi:hypothetical protein